MHYITLNKLTKKVDISPISYELNKKYFGEGCELVVEKNGKKRVFQLTYKAFKIFEFTEDLKFVKSSYVPEPIKEGWGLTHDPKTPWLIYVTDGTDKLFILETHHNFKLKKTINITY